MRKGVGAAVLSSYLELINGDNIRKERENVFDFEDTAIL